MFWIGLVLGGMFGMVVMAVFTISSRSDDDGDN